MHIYKKLNSIKIIINKGYNLYAKNNIIIEINICCFDLL